jgi:hypothetical protein
VVVFVLYFHDANNDIDRLDLAADFSLPDPKGDARAFAITCHPSSSVVYI